MTNRILVCQGLKNWPIGPAVIYIIQVCPELDIRLGHFVMPWPTEYSSAQNWTSGLVTMPCHAIHNTGLPWIGHLTWSLSHVMPYRIQFCLGMDTCIRNGYFVQFWQTKYSSVKDDSLVLSVCHAMTYTDTEYMSARDRISGLVTVLPWQKECCGFNV